VCSSDLEGVRTDVRIVNLSLLNTDWYISQLLETEPKVDLPSTINDDFLKRVGPIKWKSQEVTLKVPENIARQSVEQFNATFGAKVLEVPKEMKFTVPPTINYQNYKLLRTQDYMILNILAANKWKKPIYFATTVPRSNLVGGLEEYLRMEGLVLRVVPIKRWQIEPTIMENNITQKYQYRFQDSTVYYNDQTIGLLQNYRAAFISLGEYYVSQNEIEKIKTLFEFEEANVPENVIPWSSPQLAIRADALKLITDSTRIDAIIDTRQFNAVANLTRILYSYGKISSVQMVLEKWIAKHPEDPQALSMLSQIKGLSDQ